MYRVHVCVCRASCVGVYVCVCVNVAYYYTKSLMHHTRVRNTRMQHTPNAHTASGLHVRDMRISRKQLLFLFAATTAKLYMGQPINSWSKAITATIRAWLGM